MITKYQNLRSPNTKDPKISEVIFAFLSISFLFFGSSVVMMSSYAEPQRALPPQLEQQLQQHLQQQQGLSPTVTASPSPLLQQQLQQQGLTSNVTALLFPLLQQQQQAPPITFGQKEEPCDGLYFIGPGGVTKCW